MFRIILLPVCCLFTLCLAAQAPEDFPTTFDKASAEIELPPAVRLLDGKKYYVQYPEKLNYHPRPYDVESINPALYKLKIEPNWARKQGDADYTFRLSSPGISATPSAPVYFEGARPASVYAPAANLKGYIFNLRYYFPITVELVNKAGTVEKTFLFSTDSATCLIHANYLLDPHTTEDVFNPIKMTQPFASEKAANDYFTANSAAIYKRMEYNTWYHTMGYIKWVLGIAYGNTKLGQEDFYAKTFVNKKGKAQYPALMDAIDQQHDLISDLDDDKKKAAAMEALKKNQLLFDAWVDSLASFGHKSKTVVLSHAAWGALLTGQTEKAGSHFAKYYLTDNEEYNMVGPFKAAFTMYYLHDQLKQSGPVAEPDADIAFITPPKTAAPGLDPAVVNITRQEGQVEKENGEILNGAISIEYMATSSGIVDLDLGKSATVYFTKNGGETYQFAKVNNTKRITIGSRLFEPVTRKTPAALNILNAAGGDFGNTYFMERLYEKKGFAVYRYWGPYETILVKGKDDKAVDFSSVLSNKRIAAKFLESAKGTEEFIKSKGLKNTIADAKTLIDFMADAGQ